MKLSSAVESDRIGGGFFVSVFRICLELALLAPASYDTLPTLISFF